MPRGWCLPVDVEPAPPGLGELAAALGSGREDSWRRAAALLRARLSSTAPSPQLRLAVDALCASEPGPLAVRSSAIGENAALSGLLSTFLGVRDPEALLGAIHACWLSRWSDTVLRYVFGRGLDLEQLRMSVLVQRMVPARAAGAARSHAGQVTIEGTWGLGRGLAEGEIVPDVWRCGAFRAGRKPVAAQLDVAGGERWVRLARSAWTAPCLEDASVLELMRLAQAAEQVFAAPIEVEWAVDEQRRPWLLQARAWPVAAQQEHAELERVDGCLEGLPASPGRVVGRARLARGAAALAHLGPEDVLVVERLAPGALAGVGPLAGLVLEAGGTTSHAATLARERGIPAVFAARGAARAIPHGAEVLVDGDAGRVVFRSPVRPDQARSDRGPARRPADPPRPHADRG